MNPISEFLKNYGHLFSGSAALILGAMLHRVLKELRRSAETRVKAKLAFDEVIERRPDIKKAYDVWATNR